MKAVTLAAAAVAIGAATAEDWPTDPTTTTSSTTTTSDWSYDPTTTATSSDWTYDPSTSTSSDWTYDPSTSTSSDWSYDPSTSTSTDWSYDPTTTSTSSSWSWGPKHKTKSGFSASWSVDPSSCTATVTDWALGTTTSTAYVTDYVTASEWDTTSTTTVYVTVTATQTAAWTGAWSSETDPATATGWAYDPGMCSVTIATSTGMPVWDPVADWTSYSTVYVTPVSSSSADWSDWTSTSTSSDWAAWTSTSTSSDWAAWTSTSTSSDWATWTSTSTSSDWAAWTSTSDGTAWTSTASSSAATATYTGSSTLGGSSDTWAMTYSPYTASSGCKDQGTISADIATIASKGFTSVRVYSTDCKTLEYVGNACRTSGLKMILGVFISSTGITGASGQVTDILAWAQWDIVELIVVGNEAVFNGYCSASDLAWFIGSVSSQVKAGGYTGPLTTTEPLTTWQTVGTTFCSAVDVVAANLYAFFNAETTADMAGGFIQAEINELEGICSGKDVYVMETGWPSAGNCNGVACPSPANQATAIKGIQSTSGAKVVFFSYENDMWKEPGPYDVEQYWGCADVFDTKSSGW